ncbi:hypothetical protein PAMP_014799 [Pampus punctatissimus]
MGVGMEELLSFRSVTLHLLLGLLMFLHGSSCNHCLQAMSPGATKAVVSLVVYSQITAKRLSLLVSHKQRAAFYLNGLRESTAMAESGMRLSSV